jgi:hypothetical protein
VWSQPPDSYPGCLRLNKWNHWYYLIVVASITGRIWVASHSLIIKPKIEDPFGAFQMLFHFFTIRLCLVARRMICRLQFCVKEIFRDREADFYEIQYPVESLSHFKCHETQARRLPSQTPFHCMA